MSADYGPLLDALRGVRWPARRAVAAAPAGAHRSKQRGTAGEFTEYRLYRQGDDPRALDWKLLARSDRAFVRLSDDRALLGRQGRWAEGWFSTLAGFVESGLFKPREVDVAVVVGHSMGGASLLMAALQQVVQAQKARW